MGNSGAMRDWSSANNLAEPLQPLRQFLLGNTRVRHRLPKMLRANLLRIQTRSLNQIPPMGRVTQNQ